MSAAPLHGKGGSITFTNLTLGVKEWSSDIMCDVGDTTDFAAALAGWRTYLAGVSSWKATAKANFDPANTAAPGGAASSLVLTLVAGATLTGNAIMTNWKIGTSFDGIVTCDYEFQGTSTLTIVTTPT